MTSTQPAAQGGTDTPSAETIEMKLEVVVIPVSDVDRAKAFYEGLGWRFHIGTGITSAPPGSAQNVYLIVSDIEKARAQLIERGADVSELFHREDQGQVSGPDPERASYGSYASFSDPDGNSWLLQEITERLPGR
jgi:catechol 2,3-dioxygenase-like lactoylglutathione lyase family enzyme